MNGTFFLITSSPCEKGLKPKEAYLQCQGLQSHVYKETPSVSDTLIESINHYQTLMMREYMKEPMT